MKPTCLITQIYITLWMTEIENQEPTFLLTDRLVVCGMGLGTGGSTDIHAKSLAMPSRCSKPSGRIRRLGTTPRGSRVSCNYMVK